MKRSYKVLAAATALGAIVLAGQYALAQTNTDDTPYGLMAQMMGQGGGMMGQGMGPGMMGQGPMGQGMGPGMMGQGYGPGMMSQGTGPGPGFAGAPGAQERNLSETDVQKILDGRLAWSGNKNLKVGTVSKKDDDTFVGEIVTKENSLVERLEVDRKTGFTRRVE